MTAIYVPPVRPGGTGGMMFLPAGPPPIDVLPAAAVFRHGGAMRSGTRLLAGAAKCRERLAALRERAARLYPDGGDVGVVDSDDALTLVGPFVAPMRVLRLHCAGAVLVRQDAMTMPHPAPAAVPMPEIRTAPIP